MKLIDLSIMEVRILKHLYCQNPHRNYNDPEELFKYHHGLELTSTDGMKLRLYLTSIRSGSDLRRRINPGVCIPGGTLGFIHSQLKAPRMVADTRESMPESFRRAFHDAVRALISRQLVAGFSAGYEIAEGEDGFRAPVPARWSGDDHERVVGVTLTKTGFVAARELFMQLAEEGD
ncbi:MAG: hypothetical protein HZA24_03260 [Nitrospirae bacterium]|nr:hypothetical protein [Nitrospirota bacterium]